MKHAIKRKMEEFDTSGCLDELIDILADATGMNSLKPWIIIEVYNLVYVAANYEDD